MASCSNVQTLKASNLILSLYEYGFRLPVLSCCYRHQHQHQHQHRHSHSYSTRKISVETLCPKSQNPQEDIANALRPHFEQQTPVLMQTVYSSENCPAMDIAKNHEIDSEDGTNRDNNNNTNWNNLNYLLQKVGEDTPCQVEVGGSYSNGTTERPEITFGDYIHYITMFHEKYGREGECKDTEAEAPLSIDMPTATSNSSPSGEELVYLAQNDLFPPLWDDIQIPDLCKDPSHKVGNGSLYSTMFWFGPRGCVSPLHYDPLDNLLMQFVGRKRVMLYPPAGTGGAQDGGRDGDGNGNGGQWHYAGHGIQQYNTSPIDLNESPDLIVKKYPLFSRAPTVVECILEPGSILYIPSKWWHHVTSKDTCVSVNAWWR
uniref:JmjC domain-containing protein n=1 Tax=Chaetoceros debilis TaxID=122233 RepID=A0A6S8WSU5_9STRA